jgi:hypothetical protein
LDDFRAGLKIQTELEVRGRRGAYFVHTALDLAPGAERKWHLVADVGQDSAAIVSLSGRLRKNRSELWESLETDMALNSSNLQKIVAGADGLQVSSDPLCTAHHFANVMFNVMRGGLFADGYSVRKQDFIEFIAVRNPSLLAEESRFFSQLPSELSILDLYARAEAQDREDLIRLSYAYLPLSFSRRHGDPSRPWNQFKIDLKKQEQPLDEYRLLERSPDHLSPETDGDQCKGPSRQTLVVSFPGDL